MKSSVEGGAMFSAQPQAPGPGPPHPESCGYMGSRSGSLGKAWGMFFGFLFPLNLSH